MEHKRSESSESSYSSITSKTDTYYTSSQYIDNGSSKSSCNKSSRNSSDCDRSYSCSYDNNSCDYNCGLKYSKTPIGVWNMIYSCDNACTTTGTMEWLNQLLLNGDETATAYSAPDVGNNPFPCSLSTGVGVWRHQDRKMKLEMTHIGYRCSDGNPQVYYRVRITMKLNHKGTRAKFRGEACPYDISDPTMCCPADASPICFEGYAVKVLEPKCSK